MGLAQEVRDALEALGGRLAQAGKAGERFRHEIEFARELAEASPSKRRQWENRIRQAIEVVSDRLSRGRPNIESVVRTAEAILAPLGGEAKKYTVHCVGHAHIDMNWMWPWAETVSVTYDTFATMDRLMEESPDFRFSQSQASVYFLTKQYAPELFERVKQRVAEGKWDVTASMWVEGDKNLANGEILCRHLLYTRRWLRDNLGLPADAVKIDWECDTFGHAHTLPGILRRGGVRRYYFHRAGKGLRLFWWQGKDGSRVLAYDDQPYGYNGHIGPHLGHIAVDFKKATGLRDVMFVHGVGDHGGGPTRRQLRAARELNSWPIFPNVRFSTTDDFFSIAEKKAKDLPVIDAELNYVFPGCYTSESNVKRANRMSENALAEAEAVALVARAAVGFEYPGAELWEGWRRTMFNQFHDILPGSGVRATYEYAQGLFQDTLATTSSVRTRALRALAGAVDTTALAKKHEAGNTGDSLGAGAGDESWWGEVSTLGAGAAGVEPFLVFNPNPWARTEVVTAKVWNRELPDGEVVAVDDRGKAIAGQVTERGGFWGHRFVSVTFPARDLPGLGYRTYGITRSAEVPAKAEGASADHTWRLENEFFRLQLEPGSGAVVSLVDKATDYEFVPAGQRLGLLQMLIEAHHGMTAWEIGQVVKQIDLTEGADLHVRHGGPHQATIASTRKYNDTRLTLAVSLKSGVPRIDFALNVDWRERGTPEVGVPMLKVAFPVAVEKGKATCEVPCGYVERPTDGWEVPALKWVDLSGRGVGTKAPAAVGAALLNDSKYGHNISDGMIRLTLLRGSYDPDPLPEVGESDIGFSLVPHVGAWSPSMAARLGYEFNHPVSVVATDVHDGSLPTTRGFVTVETANVLLSGIKKAEDSDSIIIRLYEMEGKQTRARVKMDRALVARRSEVVETDLLERPLETSTAKMEGDTLTVSIPPYGIATVKLGD